MPLLEDIFIDAIETPDGKILDLLPGDVDPMTRCGGEGGKPGPCPENNPDKPAAGDKPGSAPEKVNPDHAARSWSERAKELPGKVYAAAKNKATQKYQQLEARYGKKWAIGIMGAGIAGLPLPIPASSLITAAPVIAAAELYRAFKKPTKAEDTDLTPEEVEELGHRWIQQMLDEWKQEQGYEDGDQGDEQPGHGTGDDSQGKAQTRQKVMRPMAPGPLIKALQVFFRKLAREVTARLKMVDDAVTKSITVVDYFDIEAWTTLMADEMRPILAAFYDHGSKETLANLNLSGALFHTVQPKLKEGVEKAAMVFCEETLATTNMEIHDAIINLRKEISEGLVEGDVKNEMMKRVQKVFGEAETERAFRIGVTEASRGQHNAMLITAKESGVVTGKTWLLSNDACPICLPLSNKTVGLDDSFEVDGIGPYAEITAPPRHPNCRCTLLLQTGD